MRPGQPLCPCCFMPLVHNSCSLHPGHDVSDPAYPDVLKLNSLVGNDEAGVYLPHLKAYPDGEDHTTPRLVSDHKASSWMGVVQIPTSIGDWLQEMDDLGF